MRQYIVRTTLCLLCALALGACVKRETAPSTLAPDQPVSHPPLSVTFLPQKGDFISSYGDRMELGEVAALAKGYDYILVGEGHRNEVDHRVQQALLRVFSSDGACISLGLEMVAVDMQQVLDDFAKGQVGVDALAEELQWNERWGYNFHLFRDHFAIALRNGVPVAGLNVPTEVTRKISREGIGSLADEEKAFLPSEIVSPSTGQRAFLEAMLAQHEGRDEDDPEARERFFLVQSIWDTKMAEEAVRVRRKFDWPVMVVAGSAHVEHGWGIAKRIQWFDPGARILTVMPWRGGEFDPDEGDVFFYSPDSYRSRMGALLTGLPEGGLLVESVKRGSRAAEAGLRPGDVLTEASGVPLNGLFSLHVAGSKVHEADEELIFTVRRGEQTFPVNVGRLGNKADDTEEGDE